MIDSDGPRRVALIANGGGYVGPPLARLLAARGHDLAIGSPRRGLVDELEALGAGVEVVDGVHDLGDPAASRQLLQSTLDRFGRIDAAMMFSGDIVIGRFLDSTAEDFARATRGCFEAPYHFLRTVVPVMVQQGGGQVLLLTSAAAARATPGAPLYSAARQGANHLVRNVAAEVARHQVQVNAVGTNFMDFPSFLTANGITDDESRARVAGRTPMNRLGGVDECAALCLPFVDGTARFMTGQFVAFDGGWS